MRKVIQALTFLLLLLPLLVTGCQPASADHEATWLDALTFYASFDSGYNADFASGEAALYTAPSWTALDAAEPVDSNHTYVSWIPEAGRWGGAVSFNTDWDPIVFYRGEENIAYAQTDWAGTFSFWLRINPDEELADGYSDPLIITDKNWDNASLYVDFTEEDRPRHFRFAAFSDKDIWNPDGLAWEAVRPEDRPMIDLADTPFNEETWTHVAFSFQHYNTETGNGMLIGYLNGKEVGRLNDRPISINWDMDRTLMAIGRHYTGALDELAVFNRVLTQEEIEMLFKQSITDAR